MHFTKKQFCEDATNEHVSSVVDSDACHGNLSSVVVVHLRNVFHFGVFGQRQPQHFHYNVKIERTIMQNLGGINEEHTVTKETAERRRIDDDGIHIIMSEL